MTRQAWTDLERAELRRLWVDNVSVGRIAKALGKTRGSIAGQANRLGLDRRPSPIKRTAVQPMPALADAGPAPRTCQYIAGDPKLDPTKCGKPSAPGRPYCADHAAICYVRPADFKPEPWVKRRTRPKPQPTMYEIEAAE